MGGKILMVGSGVAGARVVGARVVGAPVPGRLGTAGVGTAGAGDEVATEEPQPTAITPRAAATPRAPKADAVGRLLGGDGCRGTGRR